MQADINEVTVNLTVVLGKTEMPIHKLLRMGRGAVIELDATEADEVEIRANDHAFARGQIIVTGQRISIEITELLRRPTVYNIESLAQAA